jgi:tetratricopeptide (TPR) repeat protein
VQVRHGARAARSRLPQLMYRTLILALVLTSTTARADPEAAAHLETGIRLFEAGDLDGARAELQIAYAADPTAEVGYALGQVYRKAGQCDHAIVYFRGAVAHSKSEALIKAAQYQIGRCVVEDPNSAAWRAPHDEPPVQPTVVVTSPPPPVAHASGWWRDPAGGALFGVGLAAVATGAGLLGHGQVLASDSKDDLGAYRAAGNVTEFRIAGGVVLGIGGALVLGSVIRYAVVAHRHGGPTPH